LFLFTTIYYLGSDLIYSNFLNIPGMHYILRFI
jgi:hypothetical protein